MVPESRISEFWRRLVDASNGASVPGNSAFVLGVARFERQGFDDHRRSEVMVACLHEEHRDNELYRWLDAAIINPVAVARNAAGVDFLVRPDELITFSVVSGGRTDPPDWFNELRERSGGIIGFLGRSEIRRALDKHPGLAKDFGTSAAQEVEHLKGRLLEAEGKTLRLESEVKAYARELSTFASRASRLRAEKAWEDMLGETQHRVGTLISDIYLHAQSLIKDASPETVKLCAEQISARCRDATHRLNILELREAGELNATVSDVAEIAGQMEEVCKELDIPIKVKSGLKGAIKIDSTRLLDAIRQLIENARYWVTTKHRSHRRIAVSVQRIKLASDEGADLQITVEDDGPGIDETLKELIFHPGISGRVGGKGIGLAMIRHFCSNHGGEIRETGRLGSGARFVVRLPLIQKETS